MNRRELLIAADAATVAGCLGTVGVMAGRDGVAGIVFRPCPRALGKPASEDLIRFEAGIGKRPGGNPARAMREVRG